MAYISGYSAFWQDLGTYDTLQFAIICQVVLDKPFYPILFCVLTIIASNTPASQHKQQEPTQARRASTSHGTPASTNNKARQGRHTARRKQ